MCDAIKAAYLATHCNYFLSIKMSEKKVLSKAALGRPFQLGMLYDCRTDKIIPGISLWKEEEIHKAMEMRDKDQDTMSMHTSNYEVVTDDSLSSKSFKLDLDSNLTLSVLGGSVGVSGSAKFLFDRTKSSYQARVCLVYKCTTKFKTLSEDIFAIEDIHKEVFEKKLATHVVTGIVYGVDAVFVFDKVVRDKKLLAQAKAELQAAVNYIPQLSAGGGALVDINRIKEENKNMLNCTFYGDVVLEKNLTTFGDAFDLYENLADYIKVDSPDERSVPKKVWLTPLSLLDDNAACLVREISIHLVNRAQKLRDDYNDVLAEAHDLEEFIEKLEFAGNIPHQLTRFIQLIDEHIVKFNSRLLTLLPEIRGTIEVDEMALADLLDEMSTYPFDMEGLMGWLNDKMGEAETLSHLLDKLTTLNGKNIYLNRCILCVYFAYGYRAIVYDPESACLTFIPESARCSILTCKCMFNLGFTCLGFDHL